MNVIEQVLPNTVAAALTVLVFVMGVYVGMRTARVWHSGALVNVLAVSERDFEERVMRVVRHTIAAGSSRDNIVPLPRRPERATAEQSADAPSLFV